jgi:hypothetical protein
MLHWRQPVTIASPFTRRSCQSFLLGLLGDRWSPLWQLIQSDLEGLYISIVDHVRSYYISGPTAMVPSQGEIEVLIAEMSIPWPQIRLLLKDPENRHGVLVLCIAWVTLSRCLLLESGVCSSPSNSFLPPEIVMPSPLRPRSAGAP